MSNRIEEEGKTQLLNNGEPAQEEVNMAADFGEGFNDFDIRPSSSRVKKVLMWDVKRREFEMTEQDKRDLRDYHIKDDRQWQEFEEKYKSLNPEDHPLIRRQSCCMQLILYTIAAIFLLGFLYCLFIILQLALFNLIMLVVMLVMWYKLYQICKAIINRILNNGRKKAFKSWIRELKSLNWLKEHSIEIQENAEGKWIEIHLNETQDDRDDAAIEEEANEQD